MDSPTRGSLHLFTLRGIDVWLHWSWFVVAYILISHGGQRYSHLGWSAAEYVALFAVVLLHEFGHAFACRSVGGTADTVVLWPLGGVAYVAPPARPGAYLWSVFGGPLVNLVLVAPTAGFAWYAGHAGWESAWPDGYVFALTLCLINAVQLGNLLPVYPLDGGQILYALLWYRLGRTRSLSAVSLTGLVIGGAFFVLGFLYFALATVAGPRDAATFGLLVSFMAAFVASRSLMTYSMARALRAVEDLPRHAGRACPKCSVPPPAGEFWLCEHCKRRFDLFGTRGKCPDCGAWYLEPGCPYCHEKSPVDSWDVAPPAPP